MKYVIWFVRLWYAAWMIPAGIEHFYHIYPQPGAQSPHPLAAQMLDGLLHTHLFDLVKAVELLTGLAVLFGYFMPLSLLLCMPVAFCVFWWDAPLSEWSTGSLIAGARVLGSNLLLGMACIASFRPMLAARTTAGDAMQPVRALVAPARVVFGTWMLLNGLNHFFLSLWSTPAGATLLSQELMSALVASNLLDVCMLIELLAGALVLSGRYVPAALCTVMAVSTSALYWSVLDHQPLTLALGLLAFGLNGFLLLAYRPCFDGALQPSPNTCGESDPHTTWHTTFVRPGGSTARGHYVAALVPLALAILWYAKKGPAVDYAAWGVLTLVYPAVVLHVRRLHDMARSGWWALVPTVLSVLAMAVWANRASVGAQLDVVVPWAALAASLTLAAWCGFSKTNAVPGVPLPTQVPG
ncbi:MAG: hypothetical protein RLZZ200_2479 [Pseudomonadota bacterium]|jgi:uncharacterized membrane protein YhaH (DUF805 family)